MERMAGLQQGGRSRVETHPLKTLTIDRSAVVDGPYRYLLSRTWWRYHGTWRMTYVMLNPSVADAQIDDQTIRQCMFFAYRAGAGGMDVVNLYSLISTDPKALEQHVDPVGPKTHAYWEKPLRHAGLVVAAWGSHKMATDDRVRDLLNHARRPLFCLGTTKDGAPRHPSRMAHTTQMMDWHA